MVRYYWLCAECNKPTLQDDSHVLVTSVTNDLDADRKNRKAFCAACWTSVQSNPDTIKKHISGGEKPGNKKSTDPEPKTNPRFKR